MKIGHRIEIPRDPPGQRFGGHRQLDIMQFCPVRRHISAACFFHNEENEEYYDR